MRIRKLAPPRNLSDREQILGVLHSDGTFHQEEIDVAMELVDSVLEEPGKDYDALVAEEDGKILGYVCFGHTPMTLGTYDLYWIATHREARGRKIATQLVAAMEEDLQRAGARIVRIETSQLEAYGAARSFYARIGYDEVGRIRDFYRPGDDLVTLAKKIEQPAKEVAAARA